MAYFHGFKTKDWSDWNQLNSNSVLDFTIDAISFSGSNSGKTQSGFNASDRVIGPLQRLNFPGQYDSLRFYWREPPFPSFGFHMIGENSSGNKIFGVGSDNPQWDVEGSGGMQNIYGGDGYDRWIRTDVTLNGDGTFDVEYEDQQSNTQRSSNFNVINSGPIDSILLNTKPKYDDDNGQKITVFLDDIELPVPGLNSPPNASLSVTKI